MARTIKSNPFGAGTTPTMLFACDDDNATFKNFADSGTTVTLEAGTSVVGPTSYRNGTLYGVTTTTTAFIALTGNLPTFNAGASDVRTIVIIAKPPVSAAGRMLFGPSVSKVVQMTSGDAWNYLFNDSGTASNFTSSARTDGQVNTVAFCIDYATDANSRLYIGTSASSTCANDLPSTPSVIGAVTNYQFSYFGRRNDSTSSPFNGDIYLIAFFDTLLSQANIESIHDNPYSALFDTGAPVAPKLAAHYFAMRNS